MSKRIQIASLYASIGFTYTKGTANKLDSFKKKIVDLQKSLNKIKDGAQFTFKPTKGIQELNRLQKRLGQFKAQLVSINKQLKFVIQAPAGLQGVRDITNEIKKLNKELVSVAQHSRVNIRASGRIGAGAAGGAFAGGLLGGMGGSVAGGAAAAYSAKQIFDAGNSLTGMKNALTSATGSVAKGAEEFVFLKTTADDLGLSIRGIARSYTSLIATTAAVGNEDFGLAEARDIFKATAEMSRVLNLSVDDQEGALRAMVQMLSKGTVMAEELKGQLAERLPGAVGIAAQAMGVTVAELFARLETGSVKSQDLLPKMAKLLSKMAREGGALDLAKSSPGAAAGRLGNATFDALTVFGMDGGLFYQMGAAMTEVAETINSSLGSFAEFGRIVSGILAPFKDLWNGSIFLFQKTKELADEYLLFKATLVAIGAALLAVYAPLLILGWSIVEILSQLWDIKKYFDNDGTLTATGEAVEQWRRLFPRDIVDDPTAGPGVTRLADGSLVGKLPHREFFRPGIPLAGTPYSSEVTDNSQSNSIVIHSMSLPSITSSEFLDDLVSTMTSFSGAGK